MTNDVCSYIFCLKDYFVPYSQYYTTCRASFQNFCQFPFIKLAIILYFSIKLFQLPPTASYKMLHDKFSEFGDVQHFEEKGTGAMLVMYGNEWQAEKAISILLKMFLFIG